MEAKQKPLTEEELCSTFEMLRKLTPEFEITRLAPLGHGAIFTTLVTLWMLTLQRLNGGASLTKTVKIVQNCCRSLLPDNKRVRDGTLSKNSGAYSEARKRLPMKAVELFADSVCNSSNVRHRGSADNGRTSLTAPPSPIGKTRTSTRHRLRWIPSAKDRKTNPHLPPDAVLHVILHKIELASGDCLMLVTTLSWSSEQAAAGYSRRYDVEHDIRDLKVSMQLEKIRACSEEMVRKEILGSVVAYNLVLEFRREAAKIAELPPRRLSFTGVWNTFEIFLLHQAPCVVSEWHVRYDKALQIASKDKLPNRPNRSYPRKAHPRRPKSTKFMKTIVREKTAKTEILDKPPPK